jgi:hypothetical protein
MNKHSEAQGDMITLEVAGRLLMIGPERVRQLIKAGYIQRPKPGFTTVVSAVQGYIRFLKDDARQNTKSAAASRAVDARAAEIELRIAERKREVIPREDAELAMDLVVGEVNKVFTGLPARITRDVPLRRLIEAKLNDGKAQIAEALARGKFLAETGRDTSDPDAPDAP